MKKFAALVLAVAMMLSMMTIVSAEEPRHILIGTTWDLYWIPPMRPSTPTPTTPAPWLTR